MLFDQSRFSLFGNLLDIRRRVFHNIVYVLVIWCPGLGGDELLQLVLKKSLRAEEEQEQEEEHQ